METLIGIQGLLFIALLIGLIKPKAILFWSKNKTRGTALLYIGTPWIALNLIIAGWKWATAMPYTERIAFIQSEIENSNFKKADSTLLTLPKEVRDSCNLCPEFRRLIDSVKLHELAIEEQAKREHELSTTKDALRNAIDSFPSHDFSIYLNSSEGLGQALMQIEANSFIHKLATNLNSDDEEMISLIAKHKKLTISKQKKTFPELRRAFIKITDQLMWEQNIDVEAYGSNKNVIFTGGIFASNKNISDFQSTISESLRDLRFNRAYFRWFNGAEDLTYYEISSQSDSDI